MELPVDLRKTMISRLSGKDGEEATCSEGRQKGPENGPLAPAEGRGSETPLNCLLLPSKAGEGLAGHLVPSLGSFLLRAPLVRFYWSLCLWAGPLLPQPARRRKGSRRE